MAPLRLFPVHKTPAHGNDAMSHQITITLPDGSHKHFDAPTTPLEVARSIGDRLAKAAVGARINGELADLDAPIVANCNLALLTEKTRDGKPDEGAMYLLRHSTAHVMAEAIQRVVPGAMLVYGPPLDTGFYYDIAFPEDRPLREGDFEAIEAENSARTTYPLVSSIRKCIRICR